MVTVVVVFLSLVAMLLIANAYHDASVRAAAIQKDIDELSKQQLALKDAAQRVQNALSPEQQQLLGSAHQLVDRNRFSWSLLFSHLEGVLPQSVRVARIAVRQVHTQGDHLVADLEMTVVANSSTVVTDMIGVMNKGPLFQAYLASQNLQKGRGETGSEFELLVHYTAPASFASTPDVRAANDRPAGGQEADNEPGNRKLRLLAVLVFNCHAAVPSALLNSSVWRWRLFWCCWLRLATSISCCPRSRA
jgi:Tfp pilus assembly protein PilN